MAHVICDPWGRISAEERHVRKSMLALIRLYYRTGAPAVAGMSNALSASARSTEEDTPLSETYALLTAEQREALRASIDNPPARFRQSDGTQMWQEEEQHLLGRLERGEFVGPPSQIQLVRKARDKAFSTGRN